MSDNRNFSLPRTCNDKYNTNFTEFKTEVSSIPSLPLLKSREVLSNKDAVNVASGTSCTSSKYLEIANQIAKNPRFFCAPEENVKGKSLHHAIKETDFNFIELSSSFKNLKRDFNKTRNLWIDHVKSSQKTEDTEIENHSSNIDYDDQQRDSDLESVIDNIKDNDKEIGEIFKVFDSVKNDRLLNERKLCEELAKYDNTVLETKSSEMFMKVCDYESKASSEVNSLEVSADHLTKEELPKEEPPVKSTDRTFIKRNIELVKNWKLNSAITDEEKEKLNDLLADIDVFGDSDSEKIAPIENGFKMSVEDQNAIDVINEKLKFLQEERSVDIDVNSIYNIDFKEEGWKHHTIANKLAALDKKIKSITLMEPTEPKDEEEKVS